VAVPHEQLDLVRSLWSRWTFLPRGTGGRRITGPTAHDIFAMKALVKSEQSILCKSPVSHRGHVATPLFCQLTTLLECIRTIPYVVHRVTPLVTTNGERKCAFEGLLWLTKRVVAALQPYFRNVFLGDIHNSLVVIDTIVSRYYKLLGGAICIARVGCQRLQEGSVIQGLNHPNFGEPNPNILAGATIPGAPAGSAHAGFGVISGLAPGTNMRQLQVALKYIFWSRFVIEK